MKKVRQRKLEREREKEEMGKKDRDEIQKERDCRLLQHVRAGHFLTSAQLLLI